MPSAVALVLDKLSVSKKGDPQAAHFVLVSVFRTDVPSSTPDPSAWSWRYGLP